MAALYFPTWIPKGRNLRWPTSSLLATLYICGQLMVCLSGLLLSQLWPGSPMGQLGYEGLSIQEGRFPKRGWLAFIYSIIHQVIFEDLVHANHCCGCWEYGSKQRRQKSTSRRWCTVVADSIKMSEGGKNHGRRMGKVSLGLRFHTGLVHDWQSFVNFVFWFKKVKQRIFFSF